MSNFTIAVEEEFPDVSNEAADTFDLKDKNGDERTIRYYRPVEGQVMLLMAATGRRRTEQDKIAAVIDFFMGVLDDADFRYIEERLLDRTDPFGIKHVEAIITGMMETWSGRPTQRSSDSSASLPTGGPNSTPTTPESYWSVSHSTGSSTTSTPGPSALSIQKTETGTTPDSQHP